MSKTKTPFFSFGSRGSVTDTLTSQKRGDSTLLRKKPIPADPRSLAQMYQRWDYQDQAYLWGQLTPVEKGSYQTLARPYHMTGFAYWMRTRLNTLPDIIARYRMDVIRGGLVHDSSKNSYHATRYGATIVPGLIDNALHFDGLDDYLNCGTGLVPTVALTIIGLVRPHSSGEVNIILDRNGARPYMLWIYDLNNRLRAGLGFADLTRTWRSAVGADHVFVKDIWQGFAFSWEQIDGHYTFYRNQNKYIDPATYVQALGDWTENTLVARQAANFGHLDLDHLTLYNRKLDDIEIYRYFARRYPLQ